MQSESFLLVLKTLRSDSALGDTVYFFIVLIVTAEINIIHNDIAPVNQVSVKDVSVCQ